MKTGVAIWLDNLKLGYGGTKEEMERLLADAQELSGVEYDITNLGDVYEAIHVIQEDLGLTGVAAVEASETFSGSFGAMQASAENLLANMALGEDIGPSLQTLITAVETFAFDNLFPMIGNIISQVPQIIGDTLLRVMGEIPGLLESAETFINNLAEGITSGEGTISETLTTIGHAALEMFKNIDWEGLGSAVINLIGAGLSALFEAIPTILTGIGSAAVELFKEIDWSELGSSVIDLIVEGIDWVFDNVPQMLLDIGNAALEWFQDVDWVGLGSDVIDFILEGITDLFDSIPETMESIAETAKEWFEDIDWWEIGTNIISGIIGGLWDAAGDLWDTVASVVSGAESRAESWLGIASPSKVFRDKVGRWIPAGIAEGIEEGAGDVQNALSDIAQDSVDTVDGMSIGVNGSMNMAAGPSAASYTNTFNITQQPGQSARELAQEIMQLMRLSEQQREAVWG